MPFDLSLVKKLATQNKRTLTAGAALLLGLLGGFVSAPRWDGSNHAGSPLLPRPRKARR